MEDLLDDPTEPIGSKKRTVFKISAVVIVMIYAIGIVFAYNDIFSILYTGPIIGGIGMVLIIVSVILKERIGIVLGSCIFLSVLGIFLVIYLFELSPLQALFVVPFLSGISLLVLVGILIWLFVASRRK